MAAKRRKDLFDELASPTARLYDARYAVAELEDKLCEAKMRLLKAQHDFDLEVILIRAGR